MATALAIGYDWLYDFLSDAERNEIALALKEKAKGKDKDREEHDETRGVALSAGNGVVCARLGPAGRARSLLALDLAKAAVRWKIDVPDGRSSGTHSLGIRSMGFIILKNSSRTSWGKGTNFLMKAERRRMGF